jgi:ketosteroid isomerase-like protein
MQVLPEAVVSPAVEPVLLALEFVRTIEASGDASSLMTPDAVEEEFPNRIFANGATRDVAAMRAGVARGKELFAKQLYTVHRAIGQGEVALLELEWTGELAIKLGNLDAGSTMRVRGAFVFELREGKIAKLRHYDCFDAF